MENNQEQIKKDLEKYYFYRKNGIKAGFFIRYFELLPRSKTAVEAFEKTNDEHETLFGEFRFSSIQSFRNSLKIYLSNESI
tara:strand:- start:14647 stop:14889 length:243 start_codon:yes stop_codon:yes gene_type:complete